MSKPLVTFTFRMPTSVHERAAVYAMGDRMSLNAWLLRLIDAELDKRNRRTKRLAGEKGEDQHGCNRLALGQNPANR